MNAAESLAPLQQQLVQQIAHVLIPFAKALVPFFSKDSNFYWLLVLSTLLLGMAGWWWFEREPAEGLRGFFRRHASRELWGHASARVDYRYYVINAGVYALLFAPLIFSAAALAESLRAGLTHLLGASPGWGGGTGVRVLYTVLLFVAFDFGRWLAHTLLHEVPLLWEFHKVHHSAEVLTPFTAYRVHPLDLLVTNSVPLLTTAPVTAVFLYAFPQAVNVYVFLGANFLLGFSGLLANLKHWQVWMTYGPLNGWLISPAHHQIHHSAEAQHWNKNRGFELAVWDRLYGTLYIPSSKPEKFVMGLGDGSDGQWHSVWTLYFRPFRLAARKIFRATPTGPALLFVALLSSAWTPRADAAVSVFIEELTWSELSARIAAGANTVLVPIGGTEQNGPQMTMGKHNAIVRYSAEQIAQRCGDVLVAPVLPFAPEGEFQPRSGNMLWPGTIGLRESTLQAILEDEVASLALHGFHTIVLMGDHGGSQAAQARVAQQQTAARHEQGVRVIQLDRYYDPMPFAERTRGLGLPAEAIGDHAGVVDTAELLSIKPQWLRRDRLNPKTWSGFATPPGAGGSGNPSLATTKLGRALLEQRIGAGVAQLKQNLK
jgi:sterol desaturase/sphingolipid hydroxylase (fatty acid hydroxylase superfamily)/creatinine amidohydrolase/Fe(II)-dependent formamide hydrolase-like protein